MTERTEKNMWQRKGVRPDLNTWLRVTTALYETKYGGEHTPPSNEEYEDIKSAHDYYHFIGKKLIEDFGYKDNEDVFSAISSGQENQLRHLIIKGRAYREATLRGMHN